MLMHRAKERGGSRFPSPHRAEPRYYAAGAIGQTTTAQISRTRKQSRFSTMELRMLRKVVDSNYLRSENFRDYLSHSPKSIGVITPFVELEMLKGDAPVD
jgi:hypothetical protein